MSEIDVGDTVIVIKSSSKRYISEIGVVYRQIGTYKGVLDVRFCKNAGYDTRRFSVDRVMKIEDV